MSGLRGFILPKSGRSVASMSERRGMKTSTLAGILVLTGIGIGAFLSSILPEFQFGTGTGWTGIGTPAGKPSTKTDENGETAAKTVSEEKTETPPETTQTQPEVIPDEVPPPTMVFVVISGRHYFLRSDPDDRVNQKPATLQQVVQAVQEVPGDYNGIRVKIQQLTTAKTTALRTLLDELHKAKIPRSAIRTKDEPVEE
jgi:hypothetical protein